MTDWICPREEEIVAAFIRGESCSPIDAHIEACESCREAVALVRLFETDEPEERAKTADTHVPSLIWMKAMARRREKRDRTRRLGLPIGLVAGLLASILTGILIAPSNSSFTSRSADVLVSHLPLLALPAALILLVLLLVDYANRAGRPAHGRGGTLVR